MQVLRAHASNGLVPLKANVVKAGAARDWFGA
jgi:hypothetical protein